jgi:hypothetical protein
VLLTEHRRRRLASVQCVAHQPLEERALLLDHQQLIEADRELAHDLLVEREHHTQLQQAHGRVHAQAKLDQGVAHIVRRGAGAMIPSRAPGSS